jgi:hypothetical protein
LSSTARGIHYGTVATQLERDTGTDGGIQSMDSMGLGWDCHCILGTLFMDRSLFRFGSRKSTGSAVDHRIQCRHSVVSFDQHWDGDKITTLYSGTKSNSNHHCVLSMCLWWQSIRWGRLLFGIILPLLHRGTIGTPYDPIRRRFGMSTEIGTKIFEILSRCMEK